MTYTSRGLSGCMTEQHGPSRKRHQCNNTERDMALPYRHASWWLLSCSIPLVDSLKLPPTPLYVTNVDRWLMFKEIIDCLGEERPTHDGDDSFANCVCLHLLLLAHICSCRQVSECPHFQIVFFFFFFNLQEYIDINEMCPYFVYQQSQNIVLVPLCIMFHKKKRKTWELRSNNFVYKQGHF